MSFVCGVIQHRAKSPLARGGWSWPFGRVDLRESDVLAYTPVFFGRWALHILYPEITGAGLKPYRWGGKVRLHRASGDVTITTVGGNYLRIADLLREKGVQVIETPRRFANRNATLS